MNLESKQERDRKSSKDKSSRIPSVISTHSHSPQLDFGILFCSSPWSGDVFMYTVVPCHIAGRASLSQLFARQHVSRADDTTLPAKRTLFVLNVPLHCSADALAAAFDRKGTRPTVHLHDEAVDHRSAHLVFDDPAALKRALAPKKPIELPSAHAERAAASSAPPPRETLQRRVSAFMEQFEAQERERERAADAMHNQMDDDGFVLVTRKKTGRNTSTETATGATVQVAATSGGDEPGSGPPKKKRKQMDTADFYHFQQHEKKREQLLKLREQFEHDKERIARMRASRKFKPQGYATEFI